MLNNDRRIDVAWASGLFEGEGCISIVVKPERHKTRVQLKVCMTDQDTMERLAGVFPGGKMNTFPSHLKYGNKPVWTWTLSKRNLILSVLADLLPFLGKRRTAKAIEAIAILHEKNQAERFCKRGHEKALHTKVYNTGYKECKLCRPISRAAVVVAPSPTEESR